ncbi:hypothetical protein B0O80DRAFT_502021 [Mortierella sp. GBAus27b]|nr:hypothetical protein B0O80DRAFT_502021 [Mortierella sp. GBAus27b]
MSDRKQATDTYKALIWSDEIRSSRRKNLQDAFSEFEAHHADIFWSQRQLEISSEITSNESAVDLQRAAVGKSRKGYSESMGQVGKPTQKKNSGALLSSSPSEAAPALPVASTVDDDTVTAVDTDNGDGSEKVVEVEDDSPLELSRSKAYEDALRLFKGSPLLPFFKYIFRKAQGSTDEVPQLPTDIPSTNLKRLIAYAHRVLTGNDALHDLKDVYVALSCIVSATVKDASFIFGTGLITRIVSQVTLKELALPILAKVLSPLQESFAENDYDLNFLQGEVELRLAELVLCERDGKWVTKEAKVDGMVSRQVYQILHFFCVVIGSGQFENKNSETECVAYWSHVWRILFTKTCIVVNTGEIASVATKEDMHINELLFGTVTQSGGRKTDTLVLAKEVSGGEVHYIECSVNEHKPLHAGQATLKEQSRKLVRINRSILSCTGSKKTVVFIDVHGLCGKIYGMRAVEDVYGVSAALGKICLPSNGFEMYEFLSGSSLQTLFRYKTHMVEFGQDVLQKRAHNRVHTPPNSPSLRPTTPSLFTPTKKRAGVFTPSAPVSPSLRSASRRRLA